MGACKSSSMILRGIPLSCFRRIETSAVAAMTTDASKGITGAGGQGIRLIRRLVVINLGLVAIQALSAGFLLSGYERAVTVHADVAFALQLGTLIQAAIAVVLWRRRRVPAWVAGLSIALF